MQSSSGDGIPGSTGGWSSAGETLRQGPWGPIAQVLVCRFGKAFGFNPTGTMESLQAAQQRNAKHPCSMVIILHPRGPRMRAPREEAAGGGLDGSEQGLRRTSAPLGRTALLALCRRPACPAPDTRLAISPTVGSPCTSPAPR